MLALCEIPHDHYSRVANTCRTHSTRHFRLSRWSRTNLSSALAMPRAGALPAPSVGLQQNLPGNFGSELTSGNYSALGRNGDSLGATHCI